MSKDTSPQSPQNFELIYKNILDFAGRFGLSALLQVPITGAISLGAGKVAGVPYATGSDNLRKMSVGYFVNQGAQTLKRRTYSSLLPGSVSSALAEYYGLSPLSQVAINTAFESTIASFVTREANERFHAVVGRNFPLVDSHGKGVNLTQITQEEFFRYSKNSEATKKFGLEHWRDLQKKVNFYNANLPYQALTLTARNALFSAAIFGARPLAKNFVKEHGAEIEQKVGIDPELAEGILTYSLRATFAWMTTPLDRAFTLCSSGKYSAEAVYQKISSDLMRGNFQGLFAGAAARTALCLMTATTVAEGPKLAKWVEDNITNFVDYINSHKHHPLSPKEQKQQREEINSVIADNLLGRVLVGGKEIRADWDNVASELSSDPELTKKENVSEALSRSQESTVKFLKVLERELGGAFSPVEVPSASFALRSPISSISSNEQEGTTNHR